MDHAAKGRHYLRKGKVAARYDTTTRTIERKVSARKLPGPHFPLGPGLPLWDEDELDQHDARSREAAAA